MNWMSFLTYVVVTAITPGPNNIMALSNATRLGIRRTLPFNLGVWAGFTVVTVGGAALSATLYAVLPAIKTPMLFIGAGYMLYLAWKTFQSSYAGEGNAARSGFAAGVFLQFMNPKGILFAIVSMETFILPHYQGNHWAVLGFAVFLSTVGFLATLCWTVFGGVFKRLFAKYGKTVNVIMALLLVYCAVSLFL